MPIEKTAILEVAPTFRIQWEEVQNCYVVLYPEGMIQLSTSAGEIMKRIDGQRSITSIVNELEIAFSEDNLESDVIKFMEVAYDTGWIRNKQ